MHQLADEAEDRLAALKGETAGELVRGASTTIAQYVLPALLADFSRTYPAIRLPVFSDRGAAERRDLRVQPWLDDELLLVVPAGHEWAGLGIIAPEALVDAPLVMRELGSGFAARR